MRWRHALLSAWAKPVLAVLLALPMAWLVYATFHNLLGPNPAEALSRQTGDWTLRGLCLVLAITPVRVLLQAPELLRLRRTVGVATFLYACVHLLCYAWFDQGLELEDIAKDILKRPFIWLGFAAWVLMLPWPPPRSTPPFVGWGDGAGKPCIGWSMPLPCCRCCISFGCAQAKTTSRKSGCMPPSSAA